MDKERIAAAYFYTLISIGFILYAVGILVNINVLRKIHGEYIKGFFFQKQCSDEYTEYESLRRHGYESLKNERGALDFGSFLFLLILIWVPILLAALMMGYMLSLSKTAIWIWVFALTLILLLFLLMNVLFQKTTRENFYQFFKDSYCNIEGSAGNERRYALFQGAIFLLTALLVYTYFTLHSSVDGGTNTGYTKGFIINEPAPGQSLGYEIYKHSNKHQLMVYFFVVIWIFVALWVYLSNKQYMRMRKDILCHYEGLMEDYKAALMNYIYPAPDPSIYPTKAAYDRETEIRFKRIKDHVERSYFRIHETMPSPAITEDDDSIADYAIYLMNWRGREFEDYPESPELNELRDFMYQLRTDRVYKSAFESYFKFNKWYLLIHLVVVVYILFHILFNMDSKFERWITIGIAITILIGVFLMSWYAWFDIALRV